MTPNPPDDEAPDIRAGAQRKLEEQISAIRTLDELVDFSRQLITRRRQNQINLPDAVQKIIEHLQRTPRPVQPQAVSIYLTVRRVRECAALVCGNSFVQAPDPPELIIKTINETILIALLVVIVLTSESLEATSITVAAPVGNELTVEFHCPLAKELPKACECLRSREVRIAEVDKPGCSKVTQLTLPVL